MTTKGSAKEEQRRQEEERRRQEAQRVQARDLDADDAPVDTSRPLQARDLDDPDAPVDTSRPGGPPPPPSGPDPRGPLASGPNALPPGEQGPSGPPTGLDKSFKLPQDKRDDVTAKPTATRERARGPEPTKAPEIRPGSEQPSVTAKPEPTRKKPPEPDQGEKKPDPTPAPVPTPSEEAKRAGERKEDGKNTDRPTEDKREGPTSSEEQKPEPKPTPTAKNKDAEAKATPKATSEKTPDAPKRTEIGPAPTGPDPIAKPEATADLPPLSGDEQRRAQDMLELARTFIPTIRAVETGESVSDAFAVMRDRAAKGEPLYPESEKWLEERERFYRTQAAALEDPQLKAEVERAADIAYAARIALAEQEAAVRKNLLGQTDADTIEAALLATPFRLPSLVLKPLSRAGASVGERLIKPIAADIAATVQPVLARVGKAAQEQIAKIAARIEQERDKTALSKDMLKFLAEEREKVSLERLLKDIDVNLDTGKFGGSGGGGSTARPPSGGTGGGVGTLDDAAQRRIDAVVGAAVQSYRDAIERGIVPPSTQNPTFLLRTAGGTFVFTSINAAADAVTAGTVPPGTLTVVDAEVLQKGMIEVITPKTTTRIIDPPRREYEVQEPAPVRTVTPLEPIREPEREREKPAETETPTTPVREIEPDEQGQETEEERTDPKTPPERTRDPEREPDPTEPEVQPMRREDPVPDDEPERKRIQEPERETPSKEEPGTRQQTGLRGFAEPAQEPVTAGQPKQKPRERTALQPQPKTEEVKDPKQPRPTRRRTDEPPRRLRLPEGRDIDVTKEVAPGVFAKLLGWRQGAFYRVKDVSTGAERISRKPIRGIPLAGTPQETLRILETGKKRPRFLVDVMGITKAIFAPSSRKVDFRARSYPRKRRGL